MTSPDQDRPTAIVMGLSPTGLHAARSLKRLGARVIGVGRVGEVGLSSAALSHRIVDDGSFDVLDAVSEANEGQPAVLIPTSDEYVDLIGQSPRPNLMHQTSYGSDVVDLLLTKARFYERCDALGLRYPRSVLLGKNRSPEDLDQINLPALLKPSRMHDHKTIMQGKKGWILNDTDDLKRHWPQITQFPGDLVAQEFIPGPESEIRLVCGTMRAKGEVSSLFTARKLRQYPRGIGSASVVQSSHEPEAAEMAINFLRAIGYQGIFGAEMKRHAETGDLYFIEINPRTSLWFSVSEAAGCPVVQQSYLDVATPNAAPLPCTQAHGVRWRYWLKDKVTQAGYALKPRPVFPTPDISDAGPPNAHVWAVYEAGDARPALVEPLGLARKLVRRAFTKSSAK